MNACYHIGPCTKACKEPFTVPQETPSTGEGKEPWWESPRFWKPATQGIADIPAIIAASRAKTLAECVKIVKDVSGVHTDFGWDKEYFIGQEDERNRILSDLSSLSHGENTNKE